MCHPQIWPILFLCIFCITRAPQRVHALGVNWGIQASHPLPPQTVVQMLKANNIKKVKLFDSDNSVLRALANSDVEVMVGIPNDLLISMTDAAQANSWVQNNVMRYIPGGTKIRYVAVGNEPYLKSYNGTYSESTYPALRNIQLALNNANIGDQVKATVPLNSDILSAAHSPSETVFTADIADSIIQIMDFSAQNECPFTINIHPFLSLYGNKNFPVDYAFFDGHASPVVDGQYTYHNLFDASYDSLVVALTKVGYANMSIIVGEIGWPTDGDVNANPDYAQKFNQGFVNHVASNGGTPRRPNTAIDFYLFSLIDEDMKSVAPGKFERHWGIYRYDGMPKYSLSLSGSNGKALVQATGVQYLKRQWCVLNTYIVDTSTLPDSVSYACTNADCTALGYGCSCYRYLDANGNASYAFNAYFQRQNQEMGTCSFNGLGRIVTTNPSINSCEYIIQIAYDSSSCTTKTPWKQTSTLLLALILLINMLL